MTNSIDQLSSPMNKIHLILRKNEEVVFYSLWLETERDSKPLS